MVASSASFFHSKAFLVNSSPFCPSINSLTNLSTLSLVTSPSICIPAPHSLQQNRQLVGCSAKKGQHIIGTPLHKLSMVEFQPDNRPLSLVSDTIRKEEPCFLHPQDQV
ncbi:hypothetical protein AAZX31_04G097700 [Glycine max]